MKIHFYKYQGAGNDFIILDNRDHLYDTLKFKDTIHRLCDRRFGIGADGLMILEESEGHDFKMLYYNADGQEGSLCGNGGRCIAALAHRTGIIKEKAHFLAADGLHEAYMINAEYVELKMNDVTHIDLHPEYAVLDTGSPHYVETVRDLAHYDVYHKGKAIRYSTKYPNGINVNFIEKKGNGCQIRTYERGVEDETWACGTGATAAALAWVEMNKLFELTELPMYAKGGLLTVRFNRSSLGHFKNIWLCGPAQFVFEGQIKI